MAIFPSDDLSLPAATRRYLQPLIDGYSSRFIDNIKRNAPTAGSSQARDPWGGRDKFTADCPFNLSFSNIDWLMSFWHQYKVIGFTFFDFIPKTVGLVGSYMPPDVLGTGNGVATQFTAPAKAIWSSSIAAYVNGTPVGGVTLNVGAGAQGEDKIVFPSAPANGAALTLAYKGRRRYTCEIPTPPIKATLPQSFDRERLMITVLEKF